MMTVRHHTSVWPLQPKSPRLLRATCLHVPCSHGSATALPTQCSRVLSGRMGHCVLFIKRASIWTATWVQMWPRPGSPSQNIGTLA